MKENPHDREFTVVLKEKAQVPLATTGIAIEYIFVLIRLPPQDFYPRPFQKLYY
jgi:hypothetical protein